MPSTSTTAAARQIIKLNTGSLAGLAFDGIRVFFDVPYAAAPVGPLRFQPPRPHAGWKGERDASLPGPTAPQFTRAFPMVDISPLVGDGWRKGDDFLTANIWAPAVSATGLPVMVFIHGGAFSVGSNSTTVSDGSAFARSGVICITLNYRVGIEGFLVAPGVKLNLGIHDVLEGLRWIQLNAAAFGGDPGNVTVFGESSGAMVIGLLLASPLAKGLFRRAILQSGHASMLRPPDVGFRVTQRLADHLRISPDAEGFASKSVEDCVSALEFIARPTTVVDLRGPGGLDPTFGVKVCPSIDEECVLASPLEALQSGAASDVDVLVGTNRDEMNLYFVPTGVRQTLTGAIAIAMLSASHAQAKEVLAAYGLSDEEQSAGEKFSEAMGDLMFRAAARKLALAHCGSTHMYEFDWRSPACNGELGACHGLELPFVFKTLAACTGATGIAGEDPPEELAQSIHDLWVGFAKDGSLPWAEFNRENRTVYHLGKGASIDEAPLRAEAFLV